MCLLVFEFYLQFLGAKAVKDVNPLRGESELVKVIVEYQVQVILMFSKTAHHLQSHNNQIMRICWKPSRVFQRTSRFCQVKRNSEKTIVLDPEMVFFSGATKFSFVVLRRISELHEFDLPLLPWTSRKYFLAGVYGGILNLRNATSQVRPFPV